MFVDCMIACLSTSYLVPGTDCQWVHLCNGPHKHSHLRREVETLNTIMMLYFQEGNSGFRKTYSPLLGYLLLEKASLSQPRFKGVNTRISIPLQKHVYRKQFVHAIIIMIDPFICS